MNIATNQVFLNAVNTDDKQNDKIDELLTLINKTNDTSPGIKIDKLNDKITLNLKQIQLGKYQLVYTDDVLSVRTLQNDTYVTLLEFHNNNS